jgi:plastocyanin
LETSPEAKTPRGLLIALGVISVLVLVGIGASLAVPLQPSLAGGAATTVAAGSASVFMPVNAAQVGFSPRNITVVLGVNNTVTWTNRDSIIHTVYSKSVPVGSSSFRSAYISPGNTFMITLNVTGIYDYYCSIHPATMTGSIKVVSAPTASTT